jgi:hypothetical protein
MIAHGSQERITLQTLDRSLSLRRPVRDLSLADFNWVAQESIYANPVLVKRYHSGVRSSPQAHAGAARAIRGAASRTAAALSSRRLTTTH